MASTLDFLARHGAMLLVGSSILLAAAALAICSLRSPLHRLRVAEQALLAILLWLVLACIPLPRLGLERLCLSASQDGVVAVQDAATRPGVLDKDKSPIARHASAAVRLPREAVRPPQGKPEPRPAGGESLAEAKEPAAANLRASMRQAASALQPLLPMPRGGLPRSTTQQPVANQREASAAATPVGDNRATEWHEWLAALYLAGGAACAGWLLLGRLALWRMVRRARAPQAWLGELFESLIPPSSRRPRLLVTESSNRPLSCGLLRPVVVLPQDCCRPELAGEVRQVLLHELAHVEQGDAWGHQLFNLTLPLLYFHPLYWLVRSFAQLSRELVADDWAARRSTAETYAQELIAFAKRHLRGAAYSGALAIFHSPTQFYRRMTMLIERERPLVTRCSSPWRILALVSWTVIVATTASMWGIQQVEAQAPRDDKEAPIDEKQAPIDEKVDKGDLRGLSPQHLQLLKFVQDLQSAAEKGTGDLEALQGIEEKIRAAQAPEELEALAADLKKIAWAIHEGHKADKADPDALSDQQLKLLKFLEKLQSIAAEGKGDPDGALQGIEEKIRAAQAPEELEALAADLKKLAVLLQGDKVVAIKKDDPRHGVLKSLAILRQQIVQAGEEVPEELDLLETKLSGKLPEKTADKKSLKAKEKWPRLKEKADPKGAAYPEESIADIKKLGEILELQRKMHKKGYVTDSQLEADEAALAKAKAALSQYDADQKKKEVFKEDAKWPDISMAPSASGGQLDLVRLAEAYSDAQTDMELARVQLEEYSDANSRVPGTVGPSELTKAKVSASRAERKRLLLQKIAQAAIELTEAEMAAVAEEEKGVRSLYEAGAASAKELMPFTSRKAQLEANCKILSLILAE